MGNKVGLKVKNCIWGKALRRKANGEHDWGDGHLRAVCGLHQTGLRRIVIKRGGDVSSGITGTSCIAGTRIPRYSKHDVLKGWAHRKDTRGEKYLTKHPEPV